MIETRKPDRVERRHDELVATWECVERDGRRIYVEAAVERGRLSDRVRICGSVVHGFHPENAAPVAVGLKSASEWVAERKPGKEAP